MADTADALSAFIAAMSELPLRLARIERQQAEILERLARRDDDAGWSTRAELAKQSRCSIDTIDRRAAAGEIEIRRVGRRVLVRLRPVADENEIASISAEARA